MSRWGAEREMYSGIGAAAGRAVMVWECVVGMLMVGNVWSVRWRVPDWAEDLLEGCGRGLWACGLDGRMLWIVSDGGSIVDKGCLMIRMGMSG